MDDQLETFSQGEDIRTGVRVISKIDVSLSDIFDQGEKAKTECEEDKSTSIYQFGKYKIAIKLDSEGRLLSINGSLSPEPKKCFKELFRLDEEFPETPLE